MLFYFSRRKKSQDRSPIFNPVAFSSNNYITAYSFCVPRLKFLIGMRDSKSVLKKCTGGLMCSASTAFVAQLVRAWV